MPREVRGLSASAVVRRHARLSGEVETLGVPSLQTQLLAPQLLPSGAFMTNRHRSCTNSYYAPTKHLGERP
jgi:hypothetical protein